MTQILIYALVAVVIFGSGFMFGNDHGTKKLTDYQKAQAIEAVRVEKERGNASVRVVTRYVKVAGATKVITQTVEKEVVKYAESNAGSCLDVPWRRLHDAAAANVLPDPAPGSDAAPGAAESIATVSANYAACHRTADRLEALQGWVSDQAKIGAK